MLLTVFSWYESAQAKGCEDGDDACNKYCDENAKPQNVHAVCIKACDAGRNACEDFSKDAKPARK
jgi:hypothetical protein